MKQTHELKGHLYAFITIFIWGTTFIATKILLRVSTPLEILFLRFLLGYAALWIAYPRRLKVTDAKHELYFAAAGLCGVTLYFLLENIALTFTFASNVGVISSTAPFFTALLAHFYLDSEHLDRSFVLGLITALAGVVLISFNGVSQLQLNPLGDLLALLAAVVWAIYSIIMKKISVFGYRTLPVTRRVFFYGILLMIPALFFMDFNPDFTKLLLPVNLFNILFLGLGASAICFVTWNSAVTLLGAVKTSIYIYMVPVVTVVTSVIVLSERITWIALLGIFLTLIGLFISSGKNLLQRKNS